MVVLIFVLILILVINMCRSTGSDKAPCPFDLFKLSFPFLFRKRKIQRGRYKSIRKLDQNVRSIENKGFCFGFYPLLKFRTKIGIIALIGSDYFFWHSLKFCTENGLRYVVASKPFSVKKIFLKVVCFFKK